MNFKIYVLLGVGIYAGSTSHAIFSMDAMGYIINYCESNAQYSIAQTQECDEEIIRLIKSMKGKSAAEVTIIQQQVDQLQKQRELIGRNPYLNAGSHLGNAYVNLQGKIVEEQLLGQANRQKQAIKGLFKAQGMADAAKATTETAIRELMQLRTVGVGLGLIAGYFAAKYAGQYILTHMDDPTLAQESSEKNMLELIYNFILNKKQKVSPQMQDAIVFDPTLHHDLQELAQGIRNAIKHGAPLPHCLLWGPPGTGKTEFAKWLMVFAGFKKFIYCAASDLMQFSEEKALQTVRMLFADAKKHGPTILVLDEIEGLCASRDNKAVSEKARNILTLLLSLTGSTENHDVMLVGITNRYQDLDDAVKSRLDTQLFVGLPSAPERLKILKLYIKRMLITAQSLEEKPSFIDLLLGSSVKKKTPIRITDGALSDTVLEHIVAVTEGFSGRDLSKMVLSMQMAAFASSTATLTAAMVEKIVAKKVAQHEHQHDTASGQAAPAA